MQIRDVLTLYFEAEKIIQKVRDECDSNANYADFLSRARTYFDDFTSYLYRTGNEEGYAFFTKIIKCIMREGIGVNWASFTVDDTAEWLKETVQKTEIF